MRKLYFIERQYIQSYPMAVWAESEMEALEAADDDERDEDYLYPDSGDFTHTIIHSVTEEQYESSEDFVDDDSTIYYQGREWIWSGDDAAD